MFAEACAFLAILLCLTGNISPGGWGGGHFWVPDPANISPGGWGGRHFCVPDSGNNSSLGWIGGHSPVPDSDNNSSGGCGGGHSPVFGSQPVAAVLAYLHVQISPISCNVVGLILQMLGKNTDTAIVGYRALYC